MAVETVEKLAHDRRNGRRELDVGQGVGNVTLGAASPDGLVDVHGATIIHRVGVVSLPGWGPFRWVSRIRLIRNSHCLPHDRAKRLLRWSPVEATS